VVLESQIERHLKSRLEEYGFKVFKLQTPGHTGVMDRMILWPRYCPGPPMFVELKRPTKTLRAKQEALMHDWRIRGCTVLDPCTTMGEVDQLCTDLIAKVMPSYAFAVVI
jgi:hypothetical protein